LEDVVGTTGDPPDQNDFYDDGGFNCDVDDFEACLDGDDSFMANAAEQIELTEKQDKQKEPDCQLQQSEPRTPACNRKGTSINKVENTMIPLPITPMPDYTNMTTPDLKVC
jgi:hypothetical protein